MVETTSPPEQERANKKHIIVEIIICIGVVLSVFTVIGLFVIVPVAFAYPIIVGKPKLLFIPAGVAGVAFLILLIFDATAALFLLTIFAIVIAFGVGAGLLIRHFRESRKRVKVFTIIIGIIIMLAPIIFAVEMFTGWIRAPFVQLHFRSYVARNFSDFDFAVSRPSLHFELQTFTSRVHDKNDSDFSFSISRDSGGTRISYPGDGGWSRTLDPILTQLLTDEFGDEFHRFTSSISGVRFGQRFDLTADNVRIRSHITIATECLDPETLTAKIIRYHSFIIENGFNFSQHSFGFVHPRYERSTSISLFIPLRFSLDDLPAHIEHARNNLNQHGVYQGRGFWYTSRVNFTPPTE
jgi:hypothetical protein